MGGAITYTSSPCFDIAVALNNSVNDHITSVTDDGSSSCLKTKIYRETRREKKKKRKKKKKENIDIRWAKYRYLGLWLFSRV